MSDTKPPVYIVQHNHFDPTWRRCWDRSFDYRGKRYRSYADIEERAFDGWLENARHGAVFSEGQALVVRNYLDRNPERLEELRELVEKGILELTAAGETVADTNMPSGETLLRNLVLGQRYFEDTFGVIPEVGWLEDAFGQSAQIPQIFRGCECKSVLALSYAQVPGAYWKGLDGSVIFKGTAPCGGGAGNCTKISPCDKCAGVGCEACGGSGLGRQSDIPDEQIANCLAEPRYADAPFSVVAIGGEECMPNLNLPALVAAAAKSRSDVEIKFGGFGSTAKHLADQVAKIDDPDVETSDQVEANPVSTGCYVSRIKIKQRFRHIENLVNTAERWATVAFVLTGEYHSSCLTEAWRAITFCAFHDAITSTHIDSAYCEIMDILSEAEHEASHVLEDALDEVGAHVKTSGDRTLLMLCNSESWERQDPITLNVSGMRGRPALVGPSGEEIEILDAEADGEDLSITFRAPKVPALGYSTVEVIEDAEPIDSGEVTQGPGVVENEFYRITVTEMGIASIFDKRTGDELVDSGKYLCNELILEEDIGHPWGTMQLPSFAEGLSKHTTGVRIRRSRGASEVTLTGQYRGADLNTRLLTWRQKMTIHKGYDRIDFHTAIDWDTAQRRIRIAFPTGIKTDEATYAVPYGAVKRGPYEPAMDRYPSTNGDWPAINWVDVSDGKRGCALINTGTPSHKVVDGVIFLSVLRSPADSWCLNEPEYYDCPDFDGARDSGQHEFFYSLLPHAGDHRAGSVEKRAREANVPIYAHALTGSEHGTLGLSHSFIKLDAPDNIIVTATKKADRDDSVIVRLAETGGEPGQVSVAIDGAGSNVTKVNYLERHPETVDGKVDMGPFEVATVRLETL